MTRKLSAIAAVLAPLVVVVAWLSCVIDPQPSRYNTLKSLWVVLFFHVALALGLGQAIFDGSAAKPRVIRWLNDVGATRRDRIIASGARLFLLSLLGFAVLFSIRRVLRVRLDYDSMTLIGCVFAMVFLACELFGWWLTTLPRGTARYARYLAVAWLVIAIAGMVALRSLDGIWFPFGAIVGETYVSLIRGEGPPAVFITAAVACAAAAVHAYAKD